MYTNPISDVEMPRPTRRVDRAGRTRRKGFKVVAAGDTTITLEEYLAAVERIKELKS